MPSQKTFRTKRTLAVKLKQNKPIPHWIRLRTDSTTPNEDTGGAPSDGSLTLFENLINYIDTLVASTGTVDFHSAADGSERQQQLMESIALPLGFENVSQFNSISRIVCLGQRRPQPPPTALSRSIEYEPLRVNVLPIQSANSTAAVSYLDVESNRVARKGPSSIFEEPSETGPPY
eukprot:gene25551-34109_t